MKTKSVRTGVLSVVLFWLAAAVSTQAAVPGFYIGITGGNASFGLTQRQFDLTLFNELELSQGLHLPRDASRFESRIDSDTSVFTGLVGYRLNRRVAFEAAYVDLGRVKYRAFGTTARFIQGVLTPIYFNANLRSEVSGPAFSVLANLFPPKRWEVFIRGGVFFAYTKESFRAVSDMFTVDLGSGSETSTDWLAGVGVTLHLSGRWSTRLEYERFLDVRASAATENDVALISLGLLMHF